MSGQPQSLDDLNRQLGAIQDRLLELPADAFAEKHRLMSERDRLRKEAGRFAQDHEASRDTEVIRKELAALIEQYEKLESRKVRPPAAGGGEATGAYSGFPADAVAVNAQIDDAQGIARLRDRIAQLETILVEREKSEE